MGDLGTSVSGKTVVACDKPVQPENPVVVSDKPTQNIAEPQQLPVEKDVAAQSPSHHVARELLADKNPNEVAEKPTQHPPVCEAETTCQGDRPSRDTEATYQHSGPGDP
ncbi:hypothetical protein AAF712_015151 [Marasmius tenuissimus]|uniref:Uncharacterized protein n=1 Tax=Marasmius tenuissimus TaxID=585030 RepID=A0ABR2ZAD0_9AGAR